mgnify:CR=1 FL=1
MRLYNRRFLTGSFLKNVVTLMSGTAMAQGFVVLCTPILTRIYDPDDFGVLTVYLGVITVITVITCGRYELSIVLPEKDSDAVNLFVLSTIITLMLTILIIIFATFIQWSSLSLVVRLKDICGSWVWFIPISIFATGLFQALNYWNIRRKNFGQLAIRQITQSITMILVQLTMGLLIAANERSLIIGLVSGQLVAVIVLFINTWKKDGKFILRSVSYLNLDPASNLQGSNN